MEEGYQIRERREIKGDETMALESSITGVKQNSFFIYDKINL
jgi:hypothetical protein